jgi:hypothetical protein
LVVIVCWGMFGVSLMLCLFVGVVLCGVSLAYVFALKNNRPEHYDTDFLESALVESGLVDLAFGPRARHVANPFTAQALETVAAEDEPARSSAAVTQRRSAATARKADSGRPAAVAAAAEARRKVTVPPEAVVPLTAYEHVREELDVVEEMLEDALSERTEV